MAEPTLILRNMHENVSENPYIFVFFVSFVVCCLFGSHYFIIITQAQAYAAAGYDI